DLGRTRGRDAGDGRRGESRCCEGNVWETRNPQDVRSLHDSSLLMSSTFAGNVPLLEPAAPPRLRRQRLLNATECSPRFRGKQESRADGREPAPGSVPWLNLAVFTRETGPIAIATARAL